MAELFLKDPGAVLDHRLQWGNALLPDVTIESCEWSVWPEEAGGVQVETSWIENLNTMVRLSGGTAGHSYCVAAKVMLSDGGVDRRSIVMRVEKR